MQGKQLKRLASVANIAKLDMAPGSMILTSQPGSGVLAWYFGIYFAGGILIDSPEQLPDIPIAPDLLQALAGLFDDNAEVLFNPGASSLELRSGRTKHAMQYGPKPTMAVLDTYRPLMATLPVVTVKTAELVAELNIIKGVATKNSAAPILSGVRIVANANRIGFQAANGASMVYQSALDAVASERFEVVPPVEEFLTALAVFADEETVGLAMAGRALVIKSERAVAKINTMAGEFPNVSAMFSGVAFDEKVSLPASSVKSLIASARAYKANPVATIRPAVVGDGIIIQTEASEIGQFEDTVDGTVSQAYSLSVDDLDVATRLAGDLIELNFSAERDVCLLQIGNRRLYMNARKS